MIRKYFPKFPLWAFSAINEISFDLFSSIFNFSSNFVKYFLKYYMQVLESIVSWWYLDDTDGSGIIWRSYVQIWFLKKHGNKSYEEKSEILLKKLS